MLPTFRSEGDVVLVDKMILRPYEKGDVIISQSKRNLSRTICKRIAGMPGDFVVMNSGVGPMLTVVPNGHVWLLGDNPSNSLDSRSYGPVPIELLQGRVLCKFSFSSRPIEIVK